MLLLGETFAITVAAGPPVGDGPHVERGGTGTRLLRVLSEPTMAGVSSQKSARWAAMLRSRELPADASVATIEGNALAAAMPGDQFSVELPGRATHDFETEAVIPIINGGWVWQGKSLGAGHFRRAYVSFVRGAFSGYLETPETRVELINAASNEPGDSPAVVFVLDHAALGSTRALSLANDGIALPPESTWTREMRRDAAEANARYEASRSLSKATPAPQSTIDLLVAYTQGMVTRHGSAAGVEARLATLVQWANTAFANSEVAITLRLVHSVGVSYPDAGSNGTALNEITGSNGSGSVAIPASLSGIAALRNTYGADLVALVRPYSNATHNGCGVAWIGGFNLSNISNAAAFGYSVTSDGGDVGGSGFFCLIGTLAHELGHNLGLEHDRANSGSIGATRYGYGYSIPATSVGDVMSYASQDAQAFSNPALICTGVNCGFNQSGQALGIAADAPVEACISSGSGCAANESALCTGNNQCADASRALNFVRVRVANFRATAAASPTLAGSIQGIAVPNGTAICASPSAGVSCSTVSGGNYSCTVPNGWTGTLHLQAGNNNRVAARRYTSGVSSAQAGQNFTVSATSSFACNLDIDNNGLLEGGIDGAMILRQLMGLTGNDRAISSSGACAQRTALADKASFVGAQNFDVNGGSNPSALLLRDGVILLRLMLGVPGSAAVAGTGLNWASVQSNINTACGVSF